MSHFVDTGRKWFYGQIIGVAAGMDDLDTKAVKTINGITGDGGVTGVVSTPSSPIIILGKGLALQSPPAWTTTQTVSRKVSPWRYYRDPGTGVATEWQAGAGGTTTGLQSLAPSSAMWCPITPELIDGSRIVRARVWFVVVGGHVWPPSRFPTIFLSRRNETTGLVEALGMVGSPAFPNPGSALAYINGGVPNLVSVVPDNIGNTAVVDLSTFTYNIGLIDDDSAGTGNTITGFEVTMTDINDQRQP